MTSPEPHPVHPTDGVEDDLLVERLDPRDHPEFARPARPAAPPVEDDYDGDQQDRADRQSLRRVVGMSTELTDITGSPRRSCATWRTRSRSRSSTGPR